MTRRPALLYSLAALVLFAFLAYFAVSTKSATIDEVPHAVAAYAHLRHGDFRPQPDHPPLWKYWAALPWLAANPPVQDYFGNDDVRRALGSIGPQWNWFIVTLYRTPGNDADRLVASSRLMMLLWAVALGAVTARFAYRAGGPLAACVAVTLFALDPNFLAHSPLVKNDVALVLCTTALAYALYLVGQRLTLPRALAVALLCAAAVTTKLTGLLAGPVIFLALLVRALLPAPWPTRLPKPGTGNQELGTRRRRLLAALSVCVACAVVTYVAIWAVYLFRFNPSPEPGLHLNAADMLAGPTANPDSLPVRLARFGLDHRLLPEAFLDGVIFTFARTDRVTYLFGQVSSAGQFSYFPVAFLTKTPLATLGVFIVAGVTPFVVRRGAARSVWLVTCLGLPILIFTGVAVASRLNIGLRHILAAYPPLFVLAGVAVARLYDVRAKVVRPVIAALLVALAGESLLAFPNYIPFFNAAAGGERGGFRILSDSNLDWGQDLPLLAEWQRGHPNRPLYLAYFGSADPAHYGIQYHNLPGGYALGPSIEPVPSSGGVVAVSATILQDVWLHPRLTAVYEPLRRRTPTEVLGGSIYLFDLDAPQ